MKSFKKYIEEFWQHLILVCLGVIFIANVLWHLFPTYGDCCDALDYWQSSKSFTGIRTAHYNLGTFVYPSLIAFVRYFPNSLNLSTEVQYSLLSITQLLLHLVSVVALSYTTYILTNNKFTTSYITYIYGFNVFIIAYTNQILTDGVAISYLLILIALFSVILLNIITSRQLIIIFGFLCGLLPMIRPSFALTSAILYIVCACAYTYRSKFNIKSFVIVGLGLCLFIIPLLFQLYLNPNILIKLNELKKMHVIYGTYLYKYMTLLEPKPHGFAAVNQSMQQIVAKCKFPEQNNCLNNVLMNNPITSIRHYLIKIFAFNDQVYLIPYVHNFFTPDRQIWRFVNCTFLSVSLMGNLVLISNWLRQPRRYVLQGLISTVIIATLLLPFINSAPEERFGLIFQPFFAFSTSIFLTTVFKSSKLQVARIKLSVAFISFALSLLIISLYIESTFSLIINS